MNSAKSSAIAALRTPLTGIKTAAAIDAPDKWIARLFTDYRELESQWRQMEMQGHCTVFQTYDWAACWYDAAASCAEAEPLIITASKGESGKPVWILPLCLYKKNGIKIISFADLGVADYAAPVMAPGAPQNEHAIRELIRQVLAALPPCDLILFEKLAADIGGIANPLLHLRGLNEFPAGCHGIRLDGPWPELAEKIMQRRLRSTIRQQKKRIETEGKVTFEYNTSPEAMTSLMAALLEMRRERFRLTGLSDMPQMWIDFYQNLVTRQSRAFSASIVTMSVEGQAIATCFGLTMGNTYYGILPTFEMGKWDSYRPGMLLFDEMLTRFAAQTGGSGYFDLTVGDEVYKKRMGCQSHPLYQWMRPKSVKGLAFFLALRAKAWLRRHPALFEKIKRTIKDPASLLQRNKKTL